MAAAAAVAAAATVAVEQRGYSVLTFRRDEYLAAVLQNVKTPRRRAPRLYIPRLTLSPARRASSTFRNRAPCNGAASFHINVPTTCVAIVRTTVW